MPSWAPRSKTGSDDRLVPEEDVLHASLPMVARLLLPPAPSHFLHRHDRTITDTRPRSVSRHVGRTCRRHRAYLRPRRSRPYRRRASAVTLPRSPVAASISMMPVVASSTFPSVRARATITPDRSTPRCNFFQPLLPRPPCFTAAHSPSPTIASPVLSTMRCVLAPAGARRNVGSRCWPRRESVV